MPPQAGLYTLLVTLAAYAIFGTSRHVVAAGTSASAVLLASTVIALHPQGSTAYAVDAATMILFCGGLFLVAGFVGLGFIAQFLSKPVIEGFVFGLAIFVTVKQLPKLFGIEGTDGDTFHQLGHLIRHLGDAHGITVVVGAAALAILFGGERWFPKIPGGLLVLVLGIAVSAGLDLPSHGVDVVGKLPSGLPDVSVPHPPAADIAPLMAGAAGMLLVIFSESLGAAQNFAAKYGYEVDANQELIALGVANAASGFVGGLPAGGSLSQSAVNEGAGARSEISPLVATVLALVTVLVLTPVFKDLPEAVLAALIIHAVSHLWKVAEFREYRRERPLEFWVGIGTGIGVIAVDVLPGPRVRRRGDGAARRVPRQPSARLRARTRPGRPGRLRRCRPPPRLHPPAGLLVLRLEAPMFYANASPVCDTVKRLAGARERPPRAVILDFGPNPQLDITTSENLEQLVKTLRGGGIDFALAEVRHNVRDTARRTGLLEAIGEDHLFHTLDEAVDAMESRWRLA